MIKIIGAGLAGCCCARLLADKRIEVELFEKENYIGGLLYDKDGEDIFQHFGPHIFHTSNPEVITFVLRFSNWVGYCNRPISVTDKGLARLPISLETLLDLKGKRLDDRTEIDPELIKENIINGYSKKQWGDTWDSSVIKRLKVSNKLSGSYFGDVFEGLPEGGFYKFLNNVIDNEKIHLHLGEEIKDLDNKDITIWTGPIDECPEIDIKLDWNGTKFERVTDNREYLTAVYNYNIKEIPYTRTTKMKLLVGCESEDVLAERPRASSAKHYVNICIDDKKRLETAINALKRQNLYFCGRAGTASYLDMDEVIENSIKLVGGIYKIVKI